MLSLLDLLILCLAAFRVTSIVYEEEIAEPIRRLVGYDGLSYPDTFIGHLFGCYYCLSVWCAGILFAVYQIAPCVVWIFAISAGAILVREYGNESLDQ